MLRQGEVIDPGLQNCKKKKIVKYSCQFFISKSTMDPGFDLLEGNLNEWAMVCLAAIKRYVMRTHQGHHLSVYGGEPPKGPYNY